MRIVFVGDVGTGKPILETAKDLGTLVAIALTERRERDKAAAHGVEILDAAALNDAESVGKLGALDVDLIVNFNSTTLFSKPLLAAPRIGAINFHPGLLPEYAGLNVHQWAMLNGETETGATIHVMTPGVDEGPVLARSKVAITETDTGLTLYLKLLRDGAALMTRVLGDIDRAGLSEAVPQDLSRRHVYRRRDRPKGRIEFARPAAQVVRFVRALSYRPMRSPLGEAVIRGPAGQIEPIGLNISDTATPLDIQPGTVVQTDANLLEIACVDRIVGIENAMLDEKRLPAGEAAERIGLRMGMIV